MPFKIDFLKDRDALLITLEGVFTPEDFDKIMKQITESTEYPANVNAIFDFAPMSFDNITSDFLKLLSIQIKKYKIKRAGAKTAYVCPTDLQFGIGRMWEVYINPLQVEILVTRSMDEAWSWIKQ